MSTETLVLIAEQEAARADSYLASVTEYTRSQLQKWIKDGALSINDKTAKGNTPVKAGDTLLLHVPQLQEFEAVPQDIPLDLAYEDDDLCVVRKPKGMVVHPAPGNPDGTLVNALLYHFGSLSTLGGSVRPGIVHRIDKETSGLLVVAKSDRAHQGLAAQFERHSVMRRYLAVVNGVPDAADPRLRGLRGVSFEAGNILKVTSQLARSKTDRQKQAVVWSNGRHAVTRARVLENFGTPPALALLECWLETGRTHQIRVHLAHAGHGLVGDPVYGGRRKLSDRALGVEGVAACAGFTRQALHAATLGFVHPVSGENLDFSAPLPADMEGLLAALRHSRANTTE